MPYSGFFRNFAPMIHNKSKMAKSVKTLKPINKGTYKRNFKAWLTRLDRRQQLRTSIPAYDSTSRVCPNCGEEYTGRYCPQCGQAGTWRRYTWRQTILNFLDIWGLGNRPVLRTVKDLFGVQDIWCVIT